VLDGRHDATDAVHGIPLTDVIGVMARVRVGVIGRSLVVQRGFATGVNAIVSSSQIDQVVFIMRNAHPTSRIFINTVTVIQFTTGTVKEMRSRPSSTTITKGPGEILSSSRIIT